MTRVARAGVNAAIIGAFTVAGVAGTLLPQPYGGLLISFLMPFGVVIRLVESEQAALVNVGTVDNVTVQAPPTPAAPPGVPVSS